MAESGGLAIESVDVLMTHNQDSDDINFILKDEDSMFDSGINIKINIDDLEPLKVFLDMEKSYDDITRYDAKLFYYPNDKNFRKGNVYNILVRVSKGVLFGKEKDILFRITRDDLEKLLNYIYNKKSSKAA